MRAVLRARGGASYYNVGDVARDQIEDYAARKRISVAEVEQRLGSCLSCEPEDVDGVEQRVAGDGQRVEAEPEVAA